MWRSRRDYPGRHQITYGGVPLCNGEVNAGVMLPSGAVANWVAVGESGIPPGDDAADDLIGDAVFGLIAQVASPDPMLQSYPSSFEFFDEAHLANSLVMTFTVQLIGGCNPRDGHVVFARPQIEDRGRRSSSVLNHLIVLGERHLIRRVREHRLLQRGPTAHVARPRRTSRACRSTAKRWQSRGSCPRRRAPTTATPGQRDLSNQFLATTGCSTRRRCAEPQP
jgi:hypothetical protein